MFSPTLLSLLDSHNGEMIISRRSKSQRQWGKEWAVTITVPTLSSGSINFYEQGDDIASLLSLVESSFSDFVNSSAFERNVSKGEK